MRNNRKTNLILLLFLIYFFEVNGQVLTNEMLEKFGFEKNFVVLPCDENVLLKSKKSNLYSIYSMEIDSGTFINEPPEALLDLSFESIKYFYSNQDLNCQFFYFKNGKMGYLPVGQFPTKNKKLHFEWDDMILYEGIIEWDGELFEQDWFWVKKDNKWGINFISEPKTIIPCAYDNVDQLPKISVISSQKEEIIYLQKKYNSNYVIPLIGEYSSEYRGTIYYSDDFNKYYQIQNRKTKRWGLYQIDYYDGKISSKEVFSQDWDAIFYEYLFGEFGTILVQKNGLWGRYDLKNQYPLTTQNYIDKESVPKVYIDESTYKKQESLKLKFNVDLIEYDQNNGDGVAKVRNATTGKWGMIQNLGQDQQQLLIPMLYDSVDFFGFNAKLTGVWLDGKVGIYTSPWTYGKENAKQTVACLYDEFKIFNVEKNVRDGLGSYNVYMDYVAVKKEGLWAWIDWMTGELKTEFLYDLDKEKMPYPEFEQEN